MPKNVTVQVDDPIAIKMERLPDVNWSSVVRNCLEDYCDRRLRVSEEKGKVVEKLEEYLRSKLPEADLEDVRKIEIDRFSAKWGKHDIADTDDLPSSEPPYIILKKRVEVITRGKPLTTLEVLNRPLFKPEDLTMFNPEVWKRQPYRGNLTQIVDGFKFQGFTVGEHCMSYDQILYLLADGNKRSATALYRLHNFYGLWAVDEKDTVLIGHETDRSK